MELYVLDSNFRMLSVLDGYESLIWTDRYNASGDFEIYTPISSDFLQYMIPGYYLFNTETNKIMIIEDLSVTSEVETGVHISVVGKSLESILSRRVIWEQKTFLNTDPIEIIFSLLQSEIEQPTNERRKITNFKHLPAPENLPSRDPIDLNLFGESLEEVIETLCASYSIGYSIVLNEHDEFVFSLYYGTDRSYAQDANPWVRFSTEYDNLVDANYQEVHSSYRNAILIKGEEDMDTHVIFKAEYDLEDAIGLERREMYTDSADINRNDDDHNPIPDSQYQALLIQRGKEVLAENKTGTVFEGGVETHVSFQYNKDYFLGDVVQIVTPTNIEARARITEIIRSFNDSGIDTVPTFSIIDE